MGKDEGSKSTMQIPSGKRSAAQIMSKKSLFKDVVDQRFDLINTQINLELKENVMTEEAANDLTSLELPS